jgi:alpha-galactosidase
MLGSLAIGENLFECTPEQLAELRGYAELYKTIRPVTHRGDVYRLESVRSGRRTVFQYASKDRREAVLFVIGHSMQFRDVLPNIRLRGLDPERVYEVEGAAPMSGQGLMTLGLPVKLAGDFDSKVIRLRG